jgi:hypothetical protein
MRRHAGSIVCAAKSEKSHHGGAINTFGHKCAFAMPTLQHTILN